MISLVQLLREAQGNPKAIILAGAPGAGKSSIVGDLISGIKVLNIDDYYIQNLKKAGVSLDLKKGDAESRSKSAIAMQQAKKDYDKELESDIEKRGSIVIDGTAASYNKTKENDDRFERSKGEDRSLMPAIVMSTWKDVTKNFFPYKELFGDNFVATTVDKKLADAQNLEDIITKYIDPYKPTNTKPKTLAQQARSDKQKAQTRQEILDLMKQENIDKILPNILSKEEAQSKLKQFLFK
jgi:adenylate kinase family enzyme